MTSELDDLYQQVILDHSKSPRNRREIEGASRHAQGYNRLCGDRVTVYLMLDGDTITDISFTGSGCAICTASASMMTQSLKNKTVQQAEAMFGQFHHLLTEDDDAPDNLDKLVVFGGVRRFPVRVKCATLPWHTFKAAVEGHANGDVSTE